MNERDACRVKQRSIDSRRGHAVFRIAHDGETDFREVHADLVRTSGDRLHLELRTCADFRFEAADHAPFCARGSIRRALAFPHSRELLLCSRSNFVRGFVLRKPGVHHERVRRRGAANDRAVGALHFTLGEKLRHRARDAVLLGHQHDPGDVAIDTVENADAGAAEMRAREIDDVHARTAFAALRENARGLVDGNEPLILPNDPSLEVERGFGRPSLGRHQSDLTRSPHVFVYARAVIAHVALLLAIVLVAAKVGAEGAARLKQPPVLGELLAGILIGNLPWPLFQSLATDASIDMLAQLGALILLFEVGLESTVREVLGVGAAAVRVATLGTVGTFAIGWAASRLVVPEIGRAGHVFIAASICATSVGISARVFKDLGKSRSTEARTILSATVIDDVIGLVLLAVVGGWICSREAGTPTSGSTLVWLVVKTLGFLAASVAVGVRVTPRIFALAARLRAPGVLLAVGLSFCFFFSWGADKMGLAPIIGAFAAGLVLEESHSALFVQRAEKSLGELIKPIAELLVPIFFVVMGIRADVRALARPSTIALALALTAAAVLGKLACGIGAPRGVSRLTVAFGMLPRGEVTLIFASFGTAMAVLDRNAYSALVTTVLLTTLLTPMLLKWSFGRAAARDA